MTTATNGTPPMPESDSAFLDLVETAIAERGDRGVITLGALVAATHFERTALKERLGRLCPPDGYLRAYDHPEFEMVLAMN